MLGDMMDVLGVLEGVGCYGTAGRRLRAREVAAQSAPGTPGSTQEVCRLREQLDVRDQYTDWD